MDIFHFSLPFNSVPISSYMELLERIGPLSKLNFFGLIVIIIGIAGYLLKEAKFLKLQNDLIGTFSAWAVAVGAFLFHMSLVDEVIINLIHPYNFYHHGVFSFSPAEKIGGTVELLYYSLLIPFSQTQEMLTISNFVLGFILYIFSLFFFRRIISQFTEHKSVINFCTLLFLGFPQLIILYSNGFGSSLVAFSYLMAVAAYIDNRHKTTWVWASIIAISRPDGILYAGTFLLGYLIKNKKIPWLGGAMIAASTSIYFVMYYLYFEVIIPVPVEFKSFGLGILSEIKPIISSLMYNYLPLLISLPVLLFIGLSFKQEILKSCLPLKKIQIELFPGLLIVSLFYIITNQGVAWDQRYLYAFLIFLIISASLALIQLFKQHQVGPYNEKKLSSNLFNYGAVCIPLISICISISGGMGSISGSSMMRHTDRVIPFSAGGQLLKEIAPKNFRIAATEQATFAFFLERPIIDLWGYTTPEIAHSKKCVSTRNLKSNPDFFLSEKPEIFWFRTINRFSTRSFIPWGQPEYLMTITNFADNHNQLGDMRQVVKEYDYVILEHVSATKKPLVTILLVRNDKTETFVNTLRDLNAKEYPVRPLDSDKFLEYYQGKGDNMTKECP